MRTLVLLVVEKFIVNYGTTGAGFNVLLLVKDEFFFGVNVVLFFGTVPLLLSESISLIIYLESIWYSISNVLASRLVSFFYPLEAVETILTALSSIIDTY